MSKRKHVPELVKELRVFHHYESAKRLEELSRDLDRALTVAVSASNDAERALREEGLL
jgi:Tfp pilus assembly protein PilX